MLTILCILFMKFPQVLRGSLHSCLGGKEETRLYTLYLSLAGSKFALEDIMFTGCMLTIIKHSAL